MTVPHDNSETIGGTPLVPLRSSTGARILGKVEGRNPAFSVKCRIGASMVHDAERRGLLSPGREILEATSGNTGIALAFVGAARGYPVTLTMPDTMSRERRALLKRFGARLVLTDGTLGMKGAIAEAERLAEAEPERYFLPRQFENPANPAIHEETTGPEIWDGTDGQVDVFVAGVGTGGTITGVARYLKTTRGHDVEVVAVEPADSPVLSQVRAGQEPSPGKHGIQGIGAGFVPPVLELDLVDRVETVEIDEAITAARELATRDGLLVGISSGAAVTAARRLAVEPGREGQTIVVILPDSGERYLSTVLFADLDDEQDAVSETPALPGTAGGLA
ncbi:MAG: cysteine synthase A [Acidobacteriota bacterium]